MDIHSLHGCRLSVDSCRNPNPHTPDVQTDKHGNIWSMHICVIVLNAIALWGEPVPAIVEGVACLVTVAYFSRPCTCHSL